MTPTELHPQHNHPCTDLATLSGKDRLVRADDLRGKGMQQPFRDGG